MISKRFAFPPCCCKAGPNCWYSNLAYFHVSTLSILTASLWWTQISSTKIRLCCLRFPHSAYCPCSTEETKVTQNKSAIDLLSNVNLTRGHKEVRRSMGHIMVTARYSNQQGSKSRQASCQVQPNQKIENLSTSKTMSLGPNYTVSTA